VGLGFQVKAVVFVGRDDVWDAFGEWFQIVCSVREES
jgi:hypothetical protein